MTSLTAAERETIFVLTDDTREWIVSSSIRRDITKLKANPAFRITDEGVHGDTPYIEGVLPMNGLTIRKSAGRKASGESKRGSHLRKNTCAHTKENGESCGMVAKKGSEFCRWHQN
jgi:hypothetical protein